MKIFAFERLQADDLSTLKDRIKALNEKISTRREAMDGMSDTGKASAQLEVDRLKVELTRLKDRLKNKEPKKEWKPEKGG